MGKPEMQFTVSYLFRLIDQFTPGAGTLAGAAKRVQSSMAAAGASAAALARSLAKVGAVAAIATGAFVLSGVKDAMAFEEALTGVRRVTDITREEMLEYGKAALKIGVATNQSGVEVAEIMKQVGMMGIRGQPAIEAIARTVSEVAVAWDDVNKEVAASQLARMTAKFFGDKAPEEQAIRIREVADAINELSNRSPFKATELLNFFDRGSAAAIRFGLSAQQAAAYGGAALVLGEPSGELQGTRARMTFQRLLDAATGATSTKKGKTDLGKSFDMLGMTQDQFKEMIASNPQAALLDLMTRMQKMDKFQQQQVADGMLDARSSAQFLSIAQNLNEYKRQLAIADDVWAQEFLKDTEFMKWLKSAGGGHQELAAQMERYGKVASRAGSVQREFGKRTESLAFAMGSLGKAYDRIKILLAMPLLNPFRNVINGVTDAMSGLGDFLEVNDALGGYLVSGGAVAAIGLIGAQLVKLAAWATGAASSWAMLMGLAKVSLVLVVAAVGVATIMWIFDNWQKLVEYASTPIKFNILFPEAPEWLKSLMSLSEEGGAKVDQGAASLKSKFKNWLFGQGWVPDSMPPIEVPQGGVSPQSTAPLNPSAIPQAVSVSTKIDPIQINAGQLRVEYNGPLQGPSTVSVGGTAPRGTSTVEGGAAAPAGAR